MKTLIHRAESRGHADHGWLNTHHTLSFAIYFDQERSLFGALRVLNDDIVAPGMGFGTHPHNNMEIVSIPLKGSLEHKDSMGNGSVIRSGDIQQMSAGTGVQHSEFNPSPDQEVNFLQIWIFPKEKNISPRYGQLTFSEEDRKNAWQLVVSPDRENGSLGINQDAWFSLTDLDEGAEIEYDLHSSNSGVYLFVLEGEVSLEDTVLKRRDGVGVWDTSKVTLRASEPASILAIEVPMKFEI
ncbi:MAG: pirin family protein [Bacteroidota bacterium]|nr:pirin family protein [Bacteroidota bacterium]